MRQNHLSTSVLELSHMTSITSKPCGSPKKKRFFTPCLLFARIHCLLTNCCMLRNLISFQFEIWILQLQKKNEKQFIERFNNTLYWIYKNQNEEERKKTTTMNWTCALVNDCMYLCVSHRWGNVTWSHFIFSSVNRCTAFEFNVFLSLLLRRPLTLSLSVEFLCGDTSVENRLWHATHNKIFCAVSSFPLLCTKRIDFLFFVLTFSFCSMRAGKHAQTNSKQCMWQVERNQNIAL